MNAIRTATTPQSHRATEDLYADRVCESDPLTEKVIACAIEVHRQLGPGLLGSTYEEAMCIELREQGLEYKRQVVVPIAYKGHLLGDYRLDLMVADVGLINFNSRLLHEGVKRVVL